jgi:YidC/Oxa1 family membrane protein insertase
MGMDKNTIIGFVLIGALLIAMFAINSKNRLAYEAEQKRVADSIAKNAPKPQAKDVAKATGIITKGNDSAKLGSFAKGALPKSISILENDVMEISFSNKGAKPETIKLKKYKTHEGKPIVLDSSAFHHFNYNFNVGVNQTAEIIDLMFAPQTVIKNNDGTQTISFLASDSLGKKIKHLFTLKPNDYLLDFSIEIDGANKLFSQRALNFSWQTEALPIEKDKAYEQTQTNVCFLENGDYDFEYISSSGSKTFKQNLNWLALKQQFFVSGIVAKSKMDNVNVGWTLPNEQSKDNYLARVSTTGQIPFEGISDHQNIALQFYFGPSDYNILKKYNSQLENIVPLGSGIFAFVKYINRHFLLPVFDFLQKNVASMGIVILLLTLLIRLITSPILYKSYLSGAKMKVLKPEVDALREKYKDDQQTFGMEQMKLWKSAGVNPLGGCLPALLQIPIFMSLYYFFQSNIDLRGKGFLWAADLASYDSIAKLPFNIPFYGDHVSLFTLTAVVTSLLISLYGMSNMQDNSNPMMKYMPFIFPVLLLGVFNKLPAALTWYYTISNFITLLLQFIIQKYIIDHNKIMLEIAENRKKPVKKSKMQERIEAMQESQRKLKELKDKSGKS